MCSSCRTLGTHTGAAMQRREFVKSALASAAALSPSATSAAQTGTAPAREFYHLRKYSLRSGPQTKLTEKYLEDALIPALNRLHMSPVGAFKLDVGPETPTYYVLIPSTSAEQLINLDTLLHSDDAYLKAAAGFRDAPASAPAYERNERSLLAAFTGWPRLTAPKLEKRMFQLRTYESPSQAAHQRKVAMFNDSEFKIF